MDLDMKLKFNFNKRNRYKNICSIEGCNNSACGKYCNNYLCYGLLCNIVVLKVIKDEEK